MSRVGRTVTVPNALAAAYSGTWTPEHIGRSGASVWRVEGSAGGARGSAAAYVKAVADDGTGADVLIAELRGEVERTEWLRSQGFPCAEVLELGERHGWHYLVTAALRGHTLAEPWPAAAHPVLIAGLAEFTRSLHTIPVSSCPFRRDLEILIPAAIAAVRAGRVDEDDFDDERAGRTADDALSEMLATQPAGEDLVVCHGDLCLPNVLADPETCRIVAVVDLGRLGIADRHQDLALATRSLGPINGQYGPSAVSTFAAAYGGPIDDGLIDFYRLLDEFF